MGGRLMLAAFAALILAGEAQSGALGDPVSAFKTLCLNNDGAAAPAIGHADAAGWNAVRGEAIARLSQTPGVENVQARVTEIADGVLVLNTGVLRYPGQAGVYSDTCEVQGLGGGGAADLARFERLFGFAPSPLGPQSGRWPTTVIWMFAKDGDRLYQPGPNETVRGPLYNVIVRRDDESFRYELHAMHFPN